MMAALSRYLGRSRSAITFIVRFVRGAFVFVTYDGQNGDTDVVTATLAFAGNKQQ